MTIDKNTPSAINEGDGVWAKQEGETDDEILKVGMQLRLRVILFLT